ncbi:fasciclin domain-containing protein [Pedobacter frigoris]|uniref:FAS1 domain-containing protein n=1 Tax=Pedobacter frigoris TaxID=2571272 RepID=A0A4U1CCJ5_9SPHI|nr:fasciclin domain-containing protein [Pedobacter frigoris]TKC03672.1 hypothetical protein FA047_19105 [Pedobacter frigoris]
MKKIYSILFVLIIAGLFFSACKKNDYFVGGTIHNTKVNMSTYDFLKSNNRGLFDTLLLIVDKAGIKDQINKQGMTFFAPTDYAIRSYCEYRSILVQKVDPFKKWTVDSIIKYELPRFTDSLNIYMLPSVVSFAQSTENGKIYSTQKTNAQAVVSYESTDDVNLGYNSNSTVLPQVMYYTYLYKPLAEPFVAKEIPNTTGARTLVQTSGVESTTGIVHVLSNSHRLFFAR